MKKVVTHSGNFHTDDLLAVAVLHILHGGDIEIIRSRESEVFATADYVVDVGGAYDGVCTFDHHQVGGAGERDNGIPYASCGLVWKAFGETLTSPEIAAYLDKKIFQPVDALDVGVQVSRSVIDDVNVYSLHDYVSLHRPSWKHKEENVDDIFKQLVLFMADLLKKEIQKAEDNEEGQAIVKKAYEAAEDKRVIVFDQSYPWEYFLTTVPEPLYVVTPDSAGSRWKVEAVRKEIQGFETRKPFPEMWAGLRDEALEEVTGVKGTLFAHNSRFLVVTTNKEAALQIAAKVINE